MASDNPENLTDVMSEQQQRRESGHSVILTSPSGRIKLLPPDPLYDEEVALLRSHPESRRFITFWPPICTVDFVIARRESRARDPTVVDLYVFLCDDEGTKPCFIGITGLFNIDTMNETCSVGILIHPDYFRGGYATQTLYTVLKFAFEDDSKNMHRVSFETAESNVNMRGWLENVVGHKPEFRWREAWSVHAEPGKRQDVLGYAILRSEWAAAVKERLKAKLNR